MQIFANKSDYNLGPYSCIIGVAIINYMGEQTEISFSPIDLACCFSASSG